MRILAAKGGIPQAIDDQSSDDVGGLRSQLSFGEIDDQTGAVIYQDTSKN